jgi:hypothetical protein
MKHLSLVSKRPAKAATSDISIGAIISVIAQIMTVIGTALIAKDATA